MIKKILASALIIGCIGTNISITTNAIPNVQNQCIEKKADLNFNENRSLNYNMRAAMGEQSWSSFAWNVTMEAAGYLPAGKVQKLYDKIYLVVTKAYQLGTRDWESLCWTVVDTICAFVPGAVPVKVFWSICKLTPSF